MSGDDTTPVRGLSTGKEDAIRQHVEERLRTALYALAEARQAIQRADEAAFYAVHALTYEEDVVNLLGAECVMSIHPVLLHAADMLRQNRRDMVESLCDSSEAVQYALDAARSAGGAVL